MMDRFQFLKASVLHSLVTSECTVLKGLICFKIMLPFIRCECTIARNVLHTVTPVIHRCIVTTGFKPISGN